MAAKRASSGPHNYMHVGQRQPRSSASNAAEAGPKRRRIALPFRVSLTLKKPVWVKAYHHNSAQTREAGAAVANRWLICWEDPVVNQDQHGPCLPPPSGQAAEVQDPRFFRGIPAAVRRERDWRGSLQRHASAACD